MGIQQMHDRSVPGLFGVVRASRGDVRAVFERLCPAVQPSPAWHRESLVDPEHHWAIGRVSLGVLQPGAQLSAEAAVQVLFHGDLWNPAEIDGSDAAVAGRTTADIVRAGYRQAGAAVVSRMQGAFCAAVLDTEARTVTLITDPLGSYPLYWTAAPRGLVFGSSVHAIMRSGEIRRALNREAVSDYLVFGFPFGTRTLASGVHLLPAGSALSYSWDTGSIALTRYSNMASAFSPWQGSKAEFFDALGDSFGRAVNRSFRGGHSFGLSLSGGMDSRAILSTVNGGASSLTTYTLGVDGCADQVIAHRLAAIAGTQHRFFELDASYLADFLPNLERMVSLTDGLYLSHGLTEILALNFLQQTGIEVLVRGHGGELAKASLAWPYHTDARLHAMHNTGEFVPYLLDRVNYISPRLDRRALFTPSWGDVIADGPRESLSQAVNGVSLAPADLASYLYLTEHHRRFTVASLELFRQQVDVRLPFVDDEFLRLLFRAPAEWRDGLAIHRALTARHHPALLRVRNSNSGAPGNAGPLVEAALDKVNTVFKRLNVRGFRHYHNFDAWMKAQLLQSVESVLLDPQALDRGIVEERALRTLIDETRSGAADRAYLLQVLLIVELWQRENL
jgi:asparagine synthase (glutamine-hydrolysing)